MSVEQVGELGSLEGLDWWASVDNDSQDQTVFLYRKEAGQNGLLDKFSVSPDYMPTFEDFQLCVKEAHGGGIYEARIVTPKGQFLKRLPFVILGLPKKQAEPMAQVAPVQQESGLEKVLAVIVQQNQQMQQNFLAGLQAISQNIAQIAQKPAEDPLVMVERVANVLGKTGATPQPQKTLVEQITELKTAADLIGLGGGSGGDSDNWGSLAAALVPLTEMMKENTVNERLKLEIAANQQKAKQQQQAQMVQAQTTKKNEFLSNLKGVLSQIVTYVEQGAQASAVAQGLLGIVPDKGQLYDFLSREEALADMAKLEPKVDTHWDWFAELANEVLQLIEQSANETTASPVPTTPTTDEPKAVNSQGGTGDAPNHSANGTTSPKRSRKPVNPPNGVTTGQAV